MGRSILADLCAGSQGSREDRRRLSVGNYFRYANAVVVVDYDHGAPCHQAVVYDDVHRFVPEMVELDNREISVSLHSSAIGNLVG